MSRRCPDENQLLLFVDEKLTDDAAASAISDHLEHCAECQISIEYQLERRESDVRSPTPVFSHGDSDSVEKLIDQLVTHCPPPAKSESNLVGKRLGDYELKEVIGHGASGVVYRADDLKLGRQVAIKVLRAGFASSERARTRLEREARAAASIQQQNIVAVHDVWIDPVGVSYLVMELVQGKNLQEFIRTNGPIKSRDAARITQSLLDGMSAAHAKGLVHRDLKSSNILIGGTAPKITDFGLVRDLQNDSNLTRENAIAGTPAYMSPEQVLAPHDVNNRADIYSLGIVLYEMLAGEVPFRGVDRMVLKQVIHDDPRSLRRLNDSVDRDLETICFKALSKNPDVRYQSAQEMHEDVGRMLEGRTIHARRIGVLGRAWNWSKRNSKYAALIALSSLLLVAIAIGSTASAIMIRSASLEEARQTRAALRQRDQSLETIRQLVFDVNELLEQEDFDPDLAQERLLNVALDGIAKIDATGDAAGLTDVNSMAAKNRLGDVYFRLDEFKSAKLNYDAALEFATSMSVPADKREMFLREKLRSLEGLASIAFEDASTDLADSLISQADQTAEELTSLTGKRVEPLYFESYELVLGEEQANEILAGLRETFKLQPQTEDLVMQAIEDTEGLAWFYLTDEQPNLAEEICLGLSTWLDGVDLESQSDWEPSVALGQHVALGIRAEIAFLNDELKQQIKFLRKSIDVIPRNAQDSFEHEVGESVIENLNELCDELKHLEPKEWMVNYFQLAMETSQQQHLKQPNRSRTAEFYFSDHLSLIEILHFTRQPKKADAELAQLKTALARFDLENLSPRTQQEISSRVEGVSKTH